MYLILHIKSSQPERIEDIGKCHPARGYQIGATLRANEQKKSPKMVRFGCQTPQMPPILVVMGVEIRRNECFSGIFEY